MRKPCENPERVQQSTHEGLSIDKWADSSLPVWMYINPANTLQNAKAQAARQRRTPHLPATLQFMSEASIVDDPCDVVLTSLRVE